MRLFTGIAIPAQIRERLEATLLPLRSAAPLRWSPASNFHITTKFIGAWPAAGLPTLHSTLDNLPVPGEIEITVANFGYYPNPHQPKVFFAGVRGEALAELNRSLEDALEPLGCAREQRAYSPHLTLARIAREEIRELRARVAQLGLMEFGRFRANEFHLYQSTNGPLGSEYTSLRRWPLAKKDVPVC